MKKTILLIMPEFFRYHLDVQERLRKAGHTVYFVPDRPSKNPFFKIVARKARWLLNPYLRHWYARAFAALPADLGEILIIKGECLVPEVFAAMRARFTKARVQFYLWDSIANSPGALYLIAHCDRAYTFDFDDSKAVGGLAFRPNFFTATEAELSSGPRPAFDWDLAFVGTVHSDRLRVLQRIAVACEPTTGVNASPPLRFFRYLFFQSVLLYIARRLFDPAFSFFKNDVHLTPLSGSALEKATLGARAILDVHHPKQTGITQRSIKSLALGQRLVTTNATIRNYPFYDERYVRVIDRENPVIDAVFLRAPPPPPSAAARAQELDQWLKQWGF